MDKISVIIPVYNAQNYLARALDSILLQTYKNLEIVCINDGSTDNSLDVLLEYQKKDDRIIIKTIKNSGASVARNFGLDISTGDYISFIDADDWINLTLYDTFIKSKLNAPVDVWMFNLGFCSEEKMKVLSNVSTQSKDWDGWEKDKVLTFDNCNNPLCVGSSIANKIYSKRFLVENGFRFIENSIFEDSLFNFQTLIKAKSLKVNFDIFYWYNQANSTSVTKSYGVKAFDIFQILSDMNSCLQTVKLYEDYKYAIFQHCYTTLFNVYAKTSETVRNDFYNRMYEFLTTLDLRRLNPDVCKKLKDYTDFEQFFNLDNPKEFFEYLKNKK